jgi:arginase
VPNIRRVIVFQGRAGDRVAGNIPGAHRLAERIAVDWHLPLEVVGRPAAPVSDRWDVALERAREDLIALRTAVRAEVVSGHFPLAILPTDGSAFAAQAAALAGDPATSLVWFDAHTDFNTPATTQSGFLGGMALAATCGLWDAGFGPGSAPERVVLVGARAAEAAELKLLAAANVTHIRESGNIAQQLEKVALRPKLFVHLDLDCIDPGVVPTQYREPGGLNPGLLGAALKVLSRRAPVSGLTLCE